MTTLRQFLPNEPAEFVAEAGLHIVSTPIGRARDITLHALDVLARADVLVAEDTRVLRKLMMLHGVQSDGRRILSYHDHSTETQLQSILEALKSGHSVAYTSDAGTPLVSDPGFDLIQGAHSIGAKVHVAPGASAVLAALVLAQLPASRFYFGGFLPTKSGARKSMLSSVRDAACTSVFYETPKRVMATLADAMEVFERDRDVVIARELTKKHEQLLRGTLAQLHGSLADNPSQMPEKGELVLLFGPARVLEVSDNEIHESLREYGLDQGVKTAAAAVAERLNVSRKRVYDLALKLRES